MWWPLPMSQLCEEAGGKGQRRFSGSSHSPCVCGAPQPSQPSHSRTGIELPGLEIQPGSFPDLAGSEASLEDGPWRAEIQGSAEWWRHVRLWGLSGGPTSGARINITRACEGFWGCSEQNLGGAGEASLWSRPQSSGVL